MSALEQIKSRLQKQPDNLNMIDLSEIPIRVVTEDIKKVLQRFKKVQVLVLRNCGLDSLQNLPSWKLAAIDLSQNKFKDNIINKLVTISTFTQILLMENSLESLDNLKKLAVLKNLQELDLTGNPVASQPNYRPFLFDNIKSLEILDQRYLNGDYVVDEQEEEDDESFNEGDDADSESEQYEEQEESSEKPKKGGKRK